MSESTFPVNPQLFESDQLSRLRNSFASASPFRYLVIDNFLDEGFAAELERTFPSLASMKTKYKGLNENKAEDSSFENFSEPIRNLHAYTASPVFIAWIQSLTGMKSLSAIDDRLGAGLHQGGNGSFLDIHIDYNIHPVRKMHRRLNLILFFNRNWTNDSGGALELWDKNGCFQKITPAFNRMVLFECNEISYHGYSTIYCPDEITRKSFYRYYFQPVPKGLKFHDTVFLPKATDSPVKRLLTRTKEVAKNRVKRIMFEMGLTGFLK